MKKTNTIIMMVMGILLSMVAFTAYSEGRGHGNADFGASISTMPPGLEDKGLPPGLTKQDKTPPGWSHGKKRGWFHHHHNHGVF